MEQLREDFQSASLAAFGTADTIGAIIGNTGAIVGNAVRTIGAFLSNAFLVFLTVVFILFEAAGFTAKIKLAFGAGPDPFGHLGRISAQIQTYLVTKATVSAATGVIVGIWVAIMGLDFPLLWGVRRLHVQLHSDPRLHLRGDSGGAAGAAALGPGPAVIIAAGTCS